MREKFSAVPECYTSKEPYALSSSFHVSPMRHFDDIDDLLNYGRDGELLPGQEEKAEEVARKVIQRAEEEKTDKVLLLNSTKKRCQQTSELVAAEVQKLNPNVDVEVQSVTGLDSLSQGTPILPEDYQPGDVFEGLSLAERIFNEETYGDQPNDLYRFGDPVLQEDGTYKYPELLEYFESPGESNRDLMIRLYTFIIDLAKFIEEDGSGIDVLLVTHAQIYQILNNMSVVCKKIKEGKLSLEPGELPRACWQVYQEKRAEGSKTSYDLYDISDNILKNKEVIALLRQELEYMQNLT